MLVLHIRNKSLIDLRRVHQSASAHENGRRRIPPPRIPVQHDLEDTMLKAPVQRFFLKIQV